VEDERGVCGTAVLRNGNSRCEIVIGPESCAVAALPIIQWVSANGDWPIILL